MVTTSVSSLIKRNSKYKIGARLIRATHEQIARPEWYISDRLGSWIAVRLWQFCYFFNSLRVSTISTKETSRMGMNIAQASVKEDHALFNRGQIVNILQLLMRIAFRSFILVRRFVIRWFIVIYFQILSCKASWVAGYFFWCSVAIMSTIPFHLLVTKLMIWSAVLITSKLCSMTKTFIAIIHKAFQDWANERCLQYEPVVAHPNYKRAPVEERKPWAQKPTSSLGYSSWKCRYRLSQVTLNDRHPWCGL